MRQNAADICSCERLNCEIAQTLEIRDPMFVSAKPESVSDSKLVQSTAFNSTVCVPASSVELTTDVLTEEQ